ncbi:hypothetical protein Ancab_023610 [Ancistrocladus abbreviatus]
MIIVAVHLELRYQDVTTGLMVANHRTGLGRIDVMQVNSFNGVVGLGHSCGTVTMWKPTSSNLLVKMLCHHGPLTALAFHPNGHLMATAGMERKIKLWDLRKFDVFGDFSGSQNYTRYMTHSMAKGYYIRKLLFRPYEDVLGIGHSAGWSSILIPGFGEPNFDSWVANPFETAKQRREKEVQSLLNKLPPESIMLDPTKIGTVRPSRKREKPTKQEREAEMDEAGEAVKNVPVKKKTKVRNKPSKRAKKKQQMVELAKRPFLEKKMKEEKDLSRKKQRIGEEPELPKSLQRFVRKIAAV